jgi:GTP cyclohydrolase I
MNYDFNEKTFGEVFNKALELAKENKNEAQEFFKQYIQFILEDNDKVNTIEEAERIAKSNFGYFAGYYNGKQNIVGRRLFIEV